MAKRWTRRQFLGGMALTVLSAWAGGVPLRRARAAGRLRAVHLSDFHWGYRGAYNRHPEASLQAVWSRIAALSPKPDLAVVTGDLIEATGDAAQRQARLTEVKALLDRLGMPWHAVPGEHDAFGDGGQRFEAVIGPRYYHRRLGGVEIFGLDNVSRGPFLDPGQLSWLEHEVKTLADDSVVLVLSHAPLFPLFIPWNWYTYNGDVVYRLFRRFSAKQFLFGHIHQALDRVQGGMNRAGLPTSWPLPEPGPLVRLEPWPQGATHPEMGLGFRVLDWQDGQFQEASVYLEPPPGTLGVAP
ncbi:MAG: metallophosphoesterase [Firmicutes bacterium]|nr:metallophosphoesterase [Bacillota bacterium]